MKLVIATNNLNKFFEIQNKFRDVPGLHVVSLKEFGSIPEVVEDGNTFEKNAVKKASTISKVTGLPALSDDSGLVIDALDGRPGVLSARYGGNDATDRDRNRLVLEEMHGKKNRRARFVCVVAIAFPGGKTVVANGECVGSISEGPRGEYGFGYDPIFYVPEFGKTMAEIPLEEKNKISHRARALEKAKDILMNTTWPE